MTTIADRFWDFVNKNGPNGCWDWIGLINRDGYGRVVVKKKEFHAHRFSWTLLNGKVPEGLSVLHTCDRRCCVNPTHLFLGTQQENMRDMDCKGRRRVGVGSRKKISKLAEEDARAIRWLYAGGIQQKVICIIYGVTSGTISSLINFRTWKHVHA